MAELDDKVIVTKSKITDIADALREEMSESNEYSFPTMVQKVHELGQGQGSEYTGGVGIDITNRVVSVVDTLMIRGSANGSVASIDDGADDIPLKSCIVAIDSTDGTSECNITRDGKNLFDKENVNVFNGYIATDKVIANSNHRCIYIPCKPNTTYTAQKICVVTGNDDRFAIGYCNETPANNVACYDISSITSSSFIVGNKVNLTITTGAEAKYIIIWIATATYYSQSIATTQIEIGSTATAYEEYTSTTYNIEFVDGSTPLTVHDGELDAVTGVLTVNDTTPSTTYQLAPTEVKTRLGTNNVFADCGDVDVEYVRDATLIINRLLELVSGNNNRMMMKSAVVEKADEEQKKDSVEENLDA